MTNNKHLNTYVDIMDGVGCWYDDRYTEAIVHFGEVDLHDVVEHIIDDGEDMALSLGSIGYDDVYLCYKSDSGEYDFNDHLGNGYMLEVIDDTNEQMISILTVCIEKDDQWIKDNLDTVKIVERASYEQCIGMLAMAFARVGQWMDSDEDGEEVTIPNSEVAVPGSKVE